MKVGDLVERLQQVPADLNVSALWDTLPDMEISGVYECVRPDGTREVVIDCNRDVEYLGEFYSTVIELT